MMVSIFCMLAAAQLAYTFNACTHKNMGAYNLQKKARVVFCSTFCISQANQMGYTTKSNSVRWIRYLLVQLLWHPLHKVECNVAMP